VIRHFGYVAIALELAATTNRTCRLSNATPERLRALIRANLTSLRQVLQYNDEQRIRLYRVSSQIIPFASHPVNELAWWEEEAELLAELRALAARGGQRLSMHPGQFTVLSSPQPSIVANALRDLEWHVRLLDALGAGGEGKVIIHGGGAYGDKPAAIDRFVATAAGLPAAWRRRLVIENDEHVYTAADVLAISERTGLPVVFDWLHHAVNPGPPADLTELIERCFDTWGADDGVPKVHLSSQEAGGRPGAHADWVDPADAEALLRAAPARPFDCMLEAKAKDRALRQLRFDLSRRGIVETGLGAG
jgi:UV DNA damage endonuclease